MDLTRKNVNFTSQNHGLMRNIIVTTDFSESAMNAVKYAAAIAKPLGVGNIILYHSFGNNLTDTDIPEHQLETASAPENVRTSLESVHRELRSVLDQDITIELVSNGLTLRAGIDQLAVERKAKLVVIGATGKSNMEKVLMGSNTVELASESIIPLLIVPKDISFSPIDKVVFACDLTRVSPRAPLEEVHSWVQRLQSQLLILNVVQEGKQFDSEKLDGLNRMKDMMEEFDPEYHYSENKDIAGEINSFAEKHAAGLIITIPKLYGFFGNLFRKSVSKDLIKKSKTPLLVLRDGE